jgi:hypothetical protein
MTAARTIGLGLVIASLALPPSALAQATQGTAPPTATPVAPATARSANAPANAPAAPAAAAAGIPAATKAASKPASGSATNGAAKSAPAAEAKRSAPRRLEDIQIEGEVPVPQVLFITARDQRRFMDFHHRRYLRTSLEVGEQTILPSWIAVSGPRPAEARKETSR